MNLPLIISKDQKISLRRRLEAALIEAIESNRVVSGAPLPSSRELATATGISRATVVRVYEELVRIGYLESHPGGKTYVKESPFPSTESRDTGSESEVDDNQLSGFGQHLLEIDLARGSSADQPTLFYGAPPKWALPLNDWKLILRKNCVALDPSQFEYLPHPFGSVALRSTVAQYLNRTHGLVCSPDQVVISTNSQSPLNFISQLFIKTGDTAIVESPGHIGARNIFTACGANVRAVPIDDEGLNIEALKECIDETVKIIYVTPSFHDPTGVSMSLDRRRQLIQLADTHNIILIEDAWDSDHSYISPHLPGLQSIAPQNSIFFIYSFWKVLYPLSMVGVLVVPPRFVELFLKAKWLMDGINPVLEHYTLAELIEEGHLERHLKTVKRQLKVQRQNLLEVLVSAFRSSIHLPKQSSAYWLTARFDPALVEQSLFETVAEMGLKIVSTKCFYPDPADYPVGEFIIPFARRN